MTDTGQVSTQPMIVLVTGGDAADPVLLPTTIADGSMVVAADSGLDRAVAAGLPVHHVVGDFDSVSPAALAAAEQAGTVIHRHPADKDATDLELAVDLVVERLAPAAGLTQLLVVGPAGGRLDHLLGDVLLLTSPRLGAMEVTARFGPATITVVHPGRERALWGTPGDQVSLLPVHGRVRGVTTRGLRWALVDAELGPGTSRGLSNELLVPVAAVTLDHGVVAAIQPGTAAAEVPPRSTPYDPSPRHAPDRREPTGDAP